MSLKKSWNFGLTALFILGLLTSQAQTFEGWQRSNWVPVEADGEELKNPWLGGMNSPQFSSIDMNFDGKEDLFIHDRYDNTVLTFINESTTAGEGIYRYDNSYEAFFPAINGWALMRDYDGDGLKDIFYSSSATKMGVFKNVSANGVLAFESVKPVVPSTIDQGNGPFTTSLFSLSIDLPAIHDHDGDGDLDVFAFGTDANNIVYHCNMSQELYGHSDSLEYRLCNNCWGFLREGSENNQIFLEEDCGNVVDPRSKEDMEWEQRTGLHTGGTLLGIDVNNEGNFDMAIGDISFPNVILAVVEDNLNLLDSAILQELNFPYNYTTDSDSINLEVFPALYYEDIDFDGILDLIVATNSLFNAEDDEVWMFKNSGQNALPDFELMSQSFIVGDGIDVGSSSRPVFFDHDQDGDQDLAVANLRNFEETVALSTSYLTFYENVGTPSEPSFQKQSDNYANILDLALTNAVPAFGDLDGDGDEDMIVGELTGVLHYFENTAAPNEAATFEISELSIGDFLNEQIDVGQSATPLLYDINNDDLLDMLVGHKNGSVFYFENVGSAENFAFQQVNDSLGGAIAPRLSTINGYSVPDVFETNGQRWLILGGDSGSIQAWEIDTNALEEGQLFDPIEIPAVENTFAGLNAAPFTVDLNADGEEDLFMGNGRGGIMSFIPAPVSVAEETAIQLNTLLYPNPARNQVTLDWSRCACNITQLQLIDAQGKLVEQTMVANKDRHAFDLSSLPSGMYFVQMLSDKGRFSERFVLER